ncbi:MAG TPA: hypothetical protein VFV34_11480 [Blastocatellia bacterium]|nr:hypothetical protein [Blastocatellia bacterium]
MRRSIGGQRSARGERRELATLVEADAVVVVAVPEDVVSSPAEMNSIAVVLTCRHTWKRPNVGDQAARFFSLACIAELGAP